MIVFEYYRKIAMEAFCIDDRVDEELAGLMEDLSREFLGEECPVYSQPSESELQSDEEVKDCEDEDWKKMKIELTLSLLLAIMSKIALRLMKSVVLLEVEERLRESFVLVAVVERNVLQS